MPKQFYTLNGKVYRVDDRTGSVSRVTFEDISNTAEEKTVIAYLASLSARDAKGLEDVTD